MNRILVVDDQSGVREALEDILRREGYQVSTAPNAAAALEKAESEVFDLLLADIRMPEMDGIELIQRIKAFNPWLSSILITGYPEVETARQAIRLGVTDYLVKPVQKADLCAAVAGALQRNRFSRRERVPRTGLAEQKLLRLRRAMKALAECNKALTRTTSLAESDLPYDICHILVEVAGYRSSWIGFAERDEAKTVRPTAQVGYDPGCLEGVSISLVEFQQGGGPTHGTVLMDNANTVRDKVRDRTLRKEEVSNDERSICLPLIASDRILGALNVSPADDGKFEAEEVQLLEQLASLLAHCLSDLIASGGGGRD